MSSLTLLDNWEVRQYARQILGGVLIYFRGNMHDKNDSVNNNICYTYTWAIGVNENGQIELADGSFIELGTPNQDFVNRVKDVDIHPGMTSAELSKLFANDTWKQFRLHPHILSLWTGDTDKEIYFEVGRLLQQERLNTLTKEEKEFLTEVRAKKTVGEWLYG